LRRDAFQNTAVPSSSVPYAFPQMGPLVRFSRKKRAFDLPFFLGLASVFGAKAKRDAFSFSAYVAPARSFKGTYASSPSAAHA